MKLRSALILSALSFGLMAAAEAHPNDHYRPEGRSLGERIDHGYRTGRLTPHEARRLDADRVALHRERERFWRNDGRLDWREREALRRDHRELSRDIWRQSHDRDCRDHDRWDRRGYR
ncbi:hypothetical protein [Crenobacter cavernae]|uniref:Uncharacterized protein n=1 Tax=Crenobacter cavernae TaxID=2290923 RepID=A0ABY0FAB4_9NEIS|nr:hypothetical protein [Crenobacter cavernae]RXZ42587.1 hypothetical protein EBB06_11840 [Crenobacter cavernae]